MVDENFISTIPQRSMVIVRFASENGATFISVPLRHRQFECNAGYRIDLSDFYIPTVDCIDEELRGIIYFIQECI